MRRIQCVDAHARHAAAAVEAELARAADARIEIGVARPPVADSFRRRQRLEHALGRCVDREAMQDVGHLRSPISVSADQPSRLVSPARICDQPPWWLSTIS